MNSIAFLQYRPNLEEEDAKQRPAIQSTQRLGIPYNNEIGIYIRFSSSYSAPFHQRQFASGCHETRFSWPAFALTSCHDASTSVRSSIKLTKRHQVPGTFVIGNLKTSAGVSRWRGAGPEMNGVHRGSTATNTEAEWVGS